MRVSFLTIAILATALCLVIGLAEAGGRRGHGGGHHGSGSNSHSGSGSSSDGSDSGSSSDDSGSGSQNSGSGSQSSSSGGNDDDDDGDLCFDKTCPAPSNSGKKFVCKPSGRRGTFQKKKVNANSHNGLPAPGTHGLDCSCRPCCADCAGVCNGPGVLDNNNVCCASGDFVGDTCCEGILDASGACCASGNVDCEGVCDGSAEVDCSGQCGGTKVEGRWGWGCCEPEQIASSGFCCDGDVDCRGRCNGDWVEDSVGFCCDPAHVEMGLCDVCHNHECDNSAGENQVYVCKSDGAGGYDKIAVPRWKRILGVLLSWIDWCPREHLVRPGRNGLDCDCNPCCADCNGVCDGPGQFYLDSASMERACCGSGVFDAHGDCCDSGIVNCGVCDGSCGNCGDGVVNGDEECDFNAPDSACCTSECTFADDSTVCRATGGNTCDLSEYCSGTDAACPDDVFQSSGHPCVADADPCTVDTCDGSGACTAAIVCVCGNGVVDFDEDCDVATNPCCVGCAFADPMTICRDAVDQCDTEEYCTGDSITCPVDTFNGGASCDDGDACTASDACSLETPSVCRGTDTCGECGDGLVGSMEECDDAISPHCCSNCMIQNPTDPCRAAADPCDAPEFCNAGTCPADADLPDGTTVPATEPCTDDGVCMSGTLIPGDPFGVVLSNGACCVAPNVPDTTGTGCCEAVDQVGGVCCDGVIACNECWPAGSTIVQDINGVCCHDTSLDCFGVCGGTGVGDASLCCEAGMFRDVANGLCCDLPDCNGECGDATLDNDGDCCDPHLQVNGDCCDQPDQFVDTVTDPNAPICCDLANQAADGSCCLETLDNAGACCPAADIDCATGLCVPNGPFCRNGGACNGLACDCSDGWVGVRCGVACAGFATEAECAATPCNANGACTDAGGLTDPDNGGANVACYSCVCDPGFFGPVCDCTGAAISFDGTAGIALDVPVATVFSTIVEDDYDSLPCFDAMNANAFPLNIPPPVVTSLGSRTFEINVRFDTGVMGGPLFVKFGCSNMESCGSPLLNYAISVNANGNIVIETEGQAPLASTGQIPPTSNAWHHVAVVYDAVLEVVDIYIDGSVTDTGLPFDPNANSQNVGDLAIGLTNFAGTAPSAISGCIDEVRVWNVMRTPTEISDFSFTAIDDAAVDSSLLAYFRLNEVSGALVDASTCGYPALISGSIVYRQPSDVNNCDDPNGGAGAVHLNDGEDELAAAFSGQSTGLVAVEIAGAVVVVAVLIAVLVFVVSRSENGLNIPFLGNKVRGAADGGNYASLPDNDDYSSSGGGDQDSREMEVNPNPAFAPGPDE